MLQKIDEMKKNKFWFIAKIIALIFIIITDLHSQPDSPTRSLWRSRTRFQFGTEHDSNINEDTARVIDARSLKLMFQSSARRNFSSAAVNFDYQMGFQAYWDHPRENKLINELELNASHQLTDQVQLGIEAWGRIKAFLNQDDAHDVYGTGTSGIFSHIKLPWQLSARASARMAGLNYARTQRYDYSGPEWMVSLRRPISPAWTLRTDYWRRIIHFKRDVASQTGLIQLSQQGFAKQQDQQHQLGLALEYSKKFIFHFQYWYDLNFSNVEILEFERHRLILLWGLPVSKSVLIRMFATLEDKNYQKPGRQIQPIELDLERNENNFLIFDISKTLSNDLAAICRVAWYKNETEKINKYYNKLLVNLALELRF